MSEEINDFGFTTTTEDQIRKENEETLGAMHEKVENLKLRLVSMKNLIWPLLVQLRKDPENDVIKWPNRAAAINNLMKSIEAQVSGN